MPRGGPDGGDGGKGGDVLLRADRSVGSLRAFKDHPHRRAGHGTHGAGKARHGRSGDDLVVLVPEGTVIRDRNGDVLADLVSVGDTWLAASGGRGGKGNARFLSNRRRAPTFAEQGEAGEERWLQLELKLMADVALVGFPNAGKSTLISRISAAKPKVAGYPFTTLEPHLGVVDMDGREFVVADVPGLVEGASEGRGLGHTFLRHLERSRVLLILLDLAPDHGTPPARQLEVLLEELGRYRPDLLERPRQVVGTKADVATEIGGEYQISAVTGQGIPELLGRLATVVEEARAAPAPAEVFVVHRPVPEGVRVEREGAHRFVVRGGDAERAVAVSDLTNPQALAFVHDRLRRIGVDRALVRAGVREGDEVRIGDLTFEYEDEPAPVNRGRSR